MTEEQPKKGSLKGRGREIMRGPSADDESTRDSGEWLSDEQGEDETPFEDDEAVLKWMEVDPEAHRPTFIPDQKLVDESDVRVEMDEDTYPGDPDFDAIFGERIEEDTPESFIQPPPPRPSTQTLDDVFREEDPAFDDLFGDVVSTDHLPPADDTDYSSEEPDYTTELNSPTLPARTMTLPETGDLYADDLFEDDDGVPGLTNSKSESSDTSDFDDTVPAPAAARGMWEDDFSNEPLPVPEQEEADDSLITDDFGEEPAARADRRSPEPVGDFTMEDAPTIRMNEEESAKFAELFGEAASPEDIHEEEFDTSTNQPMASEGEGEEVESTFALGEEPLEPLFDELDEETDEDVPVEDIDDIIAAHLSNSGTEEEAAYTGKVRRLDEFDEFDAFDEEEHTEYAEESPVNSSDIEATPIDASFVPSEADQRTLDLLDEMTEEIEVPDDEPWSAPEFDGDWQSVPEPEPLTPPNEAEAFVAMLEDEGYDPSESDDLPELPDEDLSATDHPLATPVLESIEKSRTEPEPFGLSMNLDDTLSSNPTLPLSAKGKVDEAMPLGERADTEAVNLGDHRLSRSVADKLIPREPEELPAGQQPFEAFDPELRDDEESGGEVVEEAEPPLFDDAETNRGMMTVPESSDPFGEKKPRPKATDLFKQPELNKADQSLVDMFIDDNRLRELFEQIEAMQEEIVQSVHSNRENTDTYQEELLDASNLLLQSRENYDDARAIVYRVRADLNRDRRVREDIRRFHPLLNNIYIGIFIGLLVLAPLGQLVISLTEDMGAAWIGQGFYPALAGAVGAWIFGMRTLHKHAVIDRDFDSSYIGVYLTFPFLGFIYGFLLYIIVLASAGVALDSNAVKNTGLSPITLVLAAAVGYFQDAITGLLGGAIGRFSSSNNG